MKLCCAIVLVGSLGAAHSQAQNAPEPASPASTLHINTRAVLVDVLVLDHHGDPVSGLKQDAFSVTEQGKPQTISYFEEHANSTETRAAKPIEFPALPPDVFSNSSPIAIPPAVNVLLLDALNTPLVDQMNLRRAVVKYIKNLKPGERVAIFTLSTRLRFVQGFTDDPAVLAAALGARKNGLPQSDSLQPHVEGASTAGPRDGAISAFQSFMGDSKGWEVDDREYRTLAALGDLAAFLGGFPGRKNLIWISARFPLNPYAVSGVSFQGMKGDGRFEGQIRDTFASLAAARVSVYPVDARGVMGYGFYTAENPVSAGQANAGASMLQESSRRTQDYATMDLLAEKTGGRAFYSNNDLSGIVGNIVSSSGNFYTISYSPTNPQMDNTFRDIVVKVAGGKYTLSYRRGYFAANVDVPPPQAAKKQDEQKEKDQAQAAAPPNPPAHPDPLLPFMELGLPQIQQIGYKATVRPMPETDAGHKRYAVDFSVAVKDLEMNLDDQSFHHGALNVSLVVYDHYGQVVSRSDRLVTMNTEPWEYKEFLANGLTFSDEIEVPKGQLWLRTGVYDQASHHVGTLEIPLASVVALQN